MKREADSTQGPAAPLSMRPIEREVLLASSGELPAARRWLLWARLRLDREARAYAAAERMLRDAVGSSGCSPRTIRRAALVPLAAAAALALGLALWSLRSGPTPSPGQAREAAAGELLETPLISRTRQLAIEAERPPGAPPTMLLACAEPPWPLGLTSLPAPAWSSLWLGASGDDPSEN